MASQTSVLLVSSTCRAGAARSRRRGVSCLGAAGAYCVLALALFPSTAPAQTYDFVISSLAIDADDGSPSAGFNMDGLYSGATSSSGCLVADRVSDLDPDQNQSGCGSGDSSCQGGVDNVLPRLVTVIDNFFDGSRDPIRTVLASLLASGQLLVLVRLEGVDSTINDPAVAVSLYLGYSADPSCSALFSRSGHFYVTNDSLTVSDDLAHPIWSATGSIVNGRLQVRYGSSTTLASEAPTGFPLNQLSLRATLDSSARTATGGNLGAWIGGATLRDLLSPLFPSLHMIFNSVVPQIDDFPNLTTGACGGDYGYPVGGAGLGLRFALTGAIILGAGDGPSAGTCANPGDGPCTTHTQNDSQNCGWCGHTCATNTYCTSGDCVVGTPTIPTRYNMTASPFGDLFSVDLAGNAWVNTGGSVNPAAWQNMGSPPGDAIRYGIVATQPTPGNQLRFALAVGASGSLWLLRFEEYIDSVGGSGWEWQEMTPPAECGTIVDMVAYTEVFDHALVTLSRCSAGKLALLGTEDWVIQDGPDVSGVVLDRTPAIAEGFDSAAVPHGYSFVFDQSGSVWAATIGQDPSNGRLTTWTWDFAGTPTNVALVGEPSITYEGATGYVGGLFVGDDGQAWELSKSSSGWIWTPHGFPSTTNCRIPDGKGFSMPIDAAQDGTHFGVVRCKGLNADNVNSVARLTYVGGQWSWDVAQVPIPAGLTTSSTGLYLYGDPFAVNYNCTNEASRGEAFFMAYDTATQSLIRMSWKSDPYSTTVPWQFINRDAPDANGPDPSPPCSGTPTCVDLVADSVTAPCTDLQSCRVLYGGPGCNPPADFNSMTETSSLSFCDFVRLSGQQPSVLLPIMECLSGYYTSGSHCLTATALMASINDNNACNIGGGN